MIYSTECQALAAAYELEVLEDCQVAVEPIEDGFALFVEPSHEWAN